MCTFSTRLYLSLLFNLSIQQIKSGCWLKDPLFQFTLAGLSLSVIVGCLPHQGLNNFMKYSFSSYGKKRETWRRSSQTWMFPRSINFSKSDISTSVDLCVRPSWSTLIAMILVRDRWPSEREYPSQIDGDKSYWKLLAANIDSNILWRAKVKESGKMVEK